MKDFAIYDKEHEMHLSIDGNLLRMTFEPVEFKTREKADTVRDEALTFFEDKDPEQVVIKATV